MSPTTVQRPDVTTAVFDDTCGNLIQITGNPAISGCGVPATPVRRAERIRDMAAGWAGFWHDRVDLDALAWGTTELLGDISDADARVDRATAHAQRLWTGAYGDDELPTPPAGLCPPTFADAHAVTSPHSAADGSPANPSTTSARTHHRLATEPVFTLPTHRHTAQP